MIGSKSAKFGQQDKVRTVGMATAPKLKRRSSDTFVGDQPSGGTNIHKILCVTEGTNFSAIQDLSGGDIYWTFPWGKNNKTSGIVHYKPVELVFF
jgi:hypothetical protein